MSFGVVRIGWSHKGQLAQTAAVLGTVDDKLCGRSVFAISRQKTFPRQSGSNKARAPPEHVGQFTMLRTSSSAKQASGRPNPVGQQLVDSTPGRGNIPK